MKRAVFDMMYFMEYCALGLRNYGKVIRNHVITDLCDFGVFVGGYPLVLVFVVTENKEECTAVRGVYDAV